MTGRCGASTCSPARRPGKTRSSRPGRSGTSAHRGGKGTRSRPSRSSPSGTISPPAASTAVEGMTLVVDTAPAETRAARRCGSGMSTGSGSRRGAGSAEWWPIRRTFRRVHVRRYRGRREQPGIHAIIHAGPGGKRRQVSHRDERGDGGRVPAAGGLEDAQGRARRRQDDRVDRAEHAGRSRPRRDCQELHHGKRTRSGVSNTCSSAAIPASSRRGSPT